MPRGPANAGWNVRVGGRWRRLSSPPGRLRAAPAADLTWTDTWPRRSSSPLSLITTTALPTWLQLVPGQCFCQCCRICSVPSSRWQSK